MDEKKYQEAKKRVEEIKGFFGHLFAYIGVNITLIIINLVTSPGALWFYWVTLFWGIGIFWHAMGVFIFSGFPGKKWEERKIKELMDRQDNK